jgi:hypothetical protein
MAFEFKAWLAQKLAREEPARPRIAPTPRRAAEPYHAVSIKPGPQSCEGAEQLAKMRFFPAKAPKLPLPDCLAPVCTCRYQHHADRRSGVDRRVPGQWHEGRVGEGDRRHRKQGRRATDAVG